MNTTGLIIGLVWGYIFYASRVFRPDVILDQFSFHDNTMFKIMCTAIITTCIGVYILHTMGVIDAMSFVRPYDMYPNIWGGVILGIGIALTGACPGTVWSQIGAGYIHAWYIVLGGLVSATLYGMYSVSIQKFFGAHSSSYVTFLPI